MSASRPTSMGMEALGGGLAVASLLVVLARWIPLPFAYQPNALGIVSPTTRLAYPVQQEPILFLAFGGLGVLAVWLLAAAVSRREASPGTAAGFQTLALLALLGSLWLGRAAATLWVLAAWAGLVALLSRCPRRPRAEPAPPLPPPPRRGHPLTWALVIVALAALRVPRLFQALEVVLAGVPDDRLTRNDWVFQSEDGQHLAWADSLLHGGLHGRDFFCLYGPLYDWSVVGVWKVVGRSLAGWHLHVGLTELLAWVAFLGVAALVVRRRWLLVPLAVLVPHLSLRIGLPFGSLFFLFRYGRWGRPRDALGAGLLTGLALLYSQEFGFAGLLCAVLVGVVVPSWRAAGAWLGGLAVPLVPVLAGYAAAGALGPMLADVVGYPRLLMAGFGNLPFPSLRASLPWAPALDPEPTRLLRVFHAVPAILGVALGVTLPRRTPHPERPLAWLRALRADWATHPRRMELGLLAVFGLACFRTALGRSDQIHLYAVAAPAILLLAVGFERLWQARAEAPRAVAFSLALGSALLVFSGMLRGPGGAGLFHLENTARTFVALFEHREPRGHGAVNRVVDWLEAHARPEDTFYFLPNDAALYYLTDRRPPTRFVVSHQMVTDAHRAEALADLQAAPPRYVVWNDATLRVDEIDDETILGPALWAWLHERYRPVERIGGMRIWEYVPPGPAAPAGDDHST